MKSFNFCITSPTFSTLAPDQELIYTGAFVLCTPDERYNHMAPPAKIARITITTNLFFKKDIKRRINNKI